MVLLPMKSYLERSLFFLNFDFFFFFVILKHQAQVSSTKTEMRICCELVTVYSRYKFPKGLACRVYSFTSRDLLICDLSIVQPMLFQAEGDLEFYVRVFNKRTLYSLYKS